MKLSILLFAAAVAVALAADPTPPTISDVFHAKVRVEINDNDKHFIGGGLYAYDVPSNQGRSDIALEDQVTKTVIQEHELFRYDLHAAYQLLDQSRTCKKTEVTGNLASPWEWVARTTYAGSTTFRGLKLDEWSSTNNNVTIRLLTTTVAPFIPYYLTVTDPIAKFQRTQEFLEFDTNKPEEWVFQVPRVCANASEVTGQSAAGDIGATVNFANANWDCADVSCSARVPSGAGQPSYECAEFSARSLAAGGFIPGLGPLDPTGNYGNYRGHNLRVVSQLYAALVALGFHGQPASPSAIQAGFPGFGNGGEGAWSHSCIGVGPGAVDCHNNARLHWPASGSFFGGVQAVLSP